MSDFMGDFRSLAFLFADHAGKVGLFLIILAVVVFAVFRAKMKQHYFPQLLSVAAYAYALPVGLLLILVAFFPALTDKIRAFPHVIAAFGTFYIIHAVQNLLKLWKEMKVQNAEK